VRENLSLYRVRAAYLRSEFSYNRPESCYAFRGKIATILILCFWLAIVIKSLGSTVIWGRGGGL